MQAVNSTVEVGRLYDELRECVQANDQDGVQRIFAELVRARRPLAEIVGEVKRLSREITRSEPQGDPPTTDEWQQPGVAPQPAEPAPEPIPDPTYTSFPKPGMPAASPLIPDSIAVYREPERGATGLDEWPSGDALPVSSTSRAAPTSQSFDGTAAFDLRGRPDTVAVPAIPDTEAAENLWSEKWAEPAALPEPEHGTPDPGHQHLGPAIEPEAVAPPVAAAIAESQDDTASDPAPQQSVTAEFEQGTLDIVTQISGRAMALGVGPDSAEAADDTRSKQRSGSSAARLAAAFAVIIGLGGGGAYLLIRPGSEQATDTPTSPAVTKTVPETKSAATEGNAAAAAPNGSVKARSSGLAATALLPPPAPGAPSPAPMAAPSQPAAIPPDTPPIAKPGAKPPVASPESPNSAAPKISAAPDKPAPAGLPLAPVIAPAAPPVPAPSIETPPAPPRSSSLETAPLLERGDRLFGMGDITSARLFYERAAEAGDGQAALRLGETYDPTFLERAKLRAIKGDLKAAAFWYRRAKELGVAEADILLKGLQTK